jgi:hypothetical protein
LIIKDRPIPYIIFQLEALLRRIQKNSPKRPQVENDLNKWWASYRGEQSVDYHLEILSKNDYSILHSLRLNNDKNFFQIDTTLLSTKFHLIIDTKNISGKIHFDKKNRQLIQTKDGEEKSLPDPISQALRHKIQLQKWLKSHGMPILPIEYLVVISNSSTIITADPNYHEVQQYVCKPDNLALKILELEQKYQKTLTQVKMIQKLGQLLIRGHTPLRSDILQNYKINKCDIRTGAQCPKCHEFSMEYKRGSWYCKLCHTKSGDAHLQAIEDYFLLHGPKATNADFREFLHLPSQRKIAYLVEKLHLPTSGTKKGMIYHQSPIQ